MTTPSAIIILAAGASNRLGQPKQLLPYRRTTLLSYTINECVAANLGAVNVILGSNAKDIGQSIHHLPCNISVNKDWSHGLGSSISFGLKNLDHQNLKSIFIVLADQPFFTCKQLQNLNAAGVSRRNPIVISKYRKGMGPPSLFHKSLFSELLLISGENGAKQIVQKHKVKTVDFPDGNIDVDTEDDLKWLK